MNSACARLSSLGGGVVRVATATPTWAKNSSSPAGAQMQSSRTVCFEALVKECGALAGMFAVSPERTTDFLPRKVASISAFENRKRLFKVVTVRTWTSTRRDQHIDEAIATIGIVARQQDCVSVA